MRRGPLAAALAAAALATLAAASAAAGAPSVLAKLPAGADARDVARDNGVVLARSFPAIGWAEFEVPGGDTPAARDRLLDDARVFRLDYQRRGESLDVHAVPSDTFTARPPTVDGVSTDYHWQQGRFYPAWDLGRASAATRIAVVDSEIDTDHSEIAGKVVAAYNAERQFPGTYGGPNVRASDAQIAEDTADPENSELHGTHVAGLAAAATDNGDGVAGAGFDAALMPVKVTLTVPAGPVGDALYVANAVNGITWAADNGADVLNMSFGTGTNHAALADAVAYAAAKDVLLVAAAGNNQQSAPGVALYPGALPDVVAVGATGPTGEITPFSTNGAYVDVAAPGSRILSTWDTRAPGVPVVGGPPLTGYEVLSGTSMASPIVAGLAALVRDLRPDLPARQVESIIEATAVDRGAPGRDPAYGAGVIDAEAALRAAAGAVVPVVAPPPPPPPPATVTTPLRRSARIAYRCTVGAKVVRAGAARRLGVARGARLVCRGRTLPALARAKLQVQRLVAARWTGIGAVRTTSAGRFVFAVPLRTLGGWTLRARLPRSATHDPAAGAAARLAVARRR